jgi:hypothetical protein
MQPDQVAVRVKISLWLLFWVLETLEYKIDAPEPMIPTQ